MTKLGPEPQQVPLTNPTAVACLAVSDDDGGDVVVGQVATGDQQALSRWAIPSLDPLGEIDGGPLTDDDDGCHSLTRRGDLIAVAGLSGQRLTLLDLGSGARSAPVATRVTWAQIRGNLLAVGGPETGIHDLRTGELCWQQDPPAPAEPSYPTQRPLVALHPDGERFAVGGSGTTDVRVHSLSEPDAEGTVLSGAPRRLRWLEYGPDGSYLIGLDAAGNSTALWSDGERTPHLPDAFGSNLSDILSVAFHPDGEYIAVGMFSGVVRIYRLTDGRRTDRKSGFHAGRLLSLGFTPNGAHLLSGDEDGKLLFWDVE